MSLGLDEESFDGKADDVDTSLYLYEALLVPMPILFGVNPRAASLDSCTRAGSPSLSFAVEIVGQELASNTMSLGMRSSPAMSTMRCSGTLMGSRVP